MTPLKIMVASILLAASLLVFNGLNANSAHEFAGQLFRGDGGVEHHEREHGAPGAPTGGEVTGSVFAEVPGLGPNGSIGEILLPDITVFLRKPSSSAMSHPVTTDLNGRFALPAHPRGVYQLCLKADGYVAGCRPDPVVVEDTTVYLSPVAIQPLPRVIAGRVTQRDQSPCRFKDAFFDVDVHTSVELVDRGKRPTKAHGVIRKVRANNLGEYLLAEVPPGSFAVRATCAGAGRTPCDDKPSGHRRSGTAECEPGGEPGGRNGQRPRRAPRGTGHRRRSDGSGRRRRRRHPSLSLEPGLSGRRVPLSRLAGDSMEAPSEQSSPHDVRSGS